MNEEIVCRYRKDEVDEKELKEFVERTPNTYLKVNGSYFFVVKVRKNEDKK